MRHVVTKLCSLACGGLFGTLLLWSQAGIAESDTKLYTVGIVPQFDARHIHRIWRPILSALEAKTQLRFQLLGSADIPRFEQQVRDGVFDFAYMNPYQLVATDRTHFYIPLLRDTGRSLQGIVVVASNSKITQVEELAGLPMAFPSPNALGSSLLPRLDLKQVFGINIEPVYVLNHSSVYLNVAMGNMVAGGGILKTLEQQPESIQRKLKVIYYTRKTPSHPFAAHENIPHSIRSLVQQSLLELSSNKAGKALFSAIPMDKPGPAAREDYQELNELKQYFREGRLND